METPTLWREAWPDRSKSGTCSLVLSFVWRRTNPRFLKAPRNLPSFQLEWLIAPHAFATLVNQRRWDEVLNAVLRGLAEKPGDPILHYWAGVARFHQRDFVQA